MNFSFFFGYVFHILFGNEFKLLIVTKLFYLVFFIWKLLNLLLLLGLVFFCKFHGVLFVWFWNCVKGNRFFEFGALLHFFIWLRGIRVEMFLVLSVVLVEVWIRLSAWDMITFRSWLSFVSSEWCFPWCLKCCSCKCCLWLILVVYSCRCSPRWLSPLWHCPSCSRICFPEYCCLLPSL